MSKKVKLKLHADRQELRDKLEQQFYDDTELLLEMVWILAGNRTFADLARSSTLCAATIRRLYSGDWSKPQAMTLMKLGYAVGLKVTWDHDQQMQYSLAKRRKELGKRLGIELSQAA